MYIINQEKSFNITFKTWLEQEIFTGMQNLEVIVFYIRILNKSDNLQKVAEILSINCEENLTYEIFCCVTKIESLYSTLPVKGIE